MTGKATVVRTDFGVGQGEWAAPQPVAREVSVNVDLVATKR
jgi:polyisoprenoid-binding protein YceI